jgi:hypothetical protein
MKIKFTTPDGLEEFSRIDNVANSKNPTTSFYAKDMKSTIIQ